MVYPARSKAVRDAASQVEPGTHDQRQLHSAPGHRTQGEADQDHRASGQAARDTTFRAVRDTPGSPGLADLAMLRSEPGLGPAGPNSPTLARLDVDGHDSVYGISGHGQDVSLRVNAISRTHAETDALQQIVKL